ncbi:hypothetical protein [Thomasclavelia cocleata]|jgi:hypothetical protein|nr:hypothetical protein [Thomasclavelia cocleata]
MKKELLSITNVILLALYLMKYQKELTCFTMNHIVYKTFSAVFNFQNEGL